MEIGLQDYHDTSIGVVITPADLPATSAELRHINTFHRCKAKILL